MGNWYVYVHTIVWLCILFRLWPHKDIILMCTYLIIYINVVLMYITIWNKSIRIVVKWSVAYGQTPNICYSYIVFCDWLMSEFCTYQKSVDSEIVPKPSSYTSYDWLNGMSPLTLCWIIVYISLPDLWQSPSLFWCSVPRVTVYSPSGSSSHPKISWQSITRPTVIQKSFNSNLGIVYLTHVHM